MNAVTRPRLGIIIVSYNGSSWINDCIRSILDNNYCCYEILVVDNASHDETVPLIENNFPEVAILRQRKNLGFGRAANIGMEHFLSRDADYIFLLNQDIRLECDCLRNLVSICEKNNNISIASPVQMNYDGSEFDTQFQRLYRSITEQLAMNNRLATESIEVETAIGASLLFRTTALREIGGFDPIFFLYHEESDLCRRARYFGYQVHIITRAIVYHHHVQLFAEEMSIKAKFSSLYGYYIFLLKNPFQLFSENIKQLLLEVRQWPSRDDGAFPFLRRWLINLAAIITIIWYLPQIMNRRKAEMLLRDRSLPLSTQA